MFFLLSPKSDAVLLLPVKVIPSLIIPARLILITTAVQGMALMLVFWLVHGFSWSSARFSCGVCLGLFPAHPTYSCIGKVFNFAFPARLKGLL